jgi:RNA polymerase sigma-70 factor (ECF subfamily)
MSPAERVAFVLHDIFDLPFAQVGDVLGRSTDAVKMLASRGRNRVRLVPPEAHQDADDRAVIDAFFAAAGSGDLSGLLEVLAPDAELRRFAPDGVTVVHGAAKIAAQAKLGARRGVALRPVLRPITARGAAGVLLVADGRPLSVMTFTVRDERITEIRTFTDPGRLAQLLPSWALRRDQ